MENQGHSGIKIKRSHDNQAKINYIRIKEEFLLTQNPKNIVIIYIQNVCSLEVKLYNYYIIIKKSSHLSYRHIRVANCPLAI